MGRETLPSKTPIADPAFVHGSNQAYRYRSVRCPRMEAESIARLVITPHKSAAVILWGLWDRERDTRSARKKTAWSLESGITGKS